MDFTEVYPDRCSTVAAAVRLGDIERPVDVRDNRGWYPIHDAAEANFTGCLALLLRQDCVDVNWRSHAEETALLLAARKGNIDSVQMLLAHGADPNLMTAEGFTPLWEAVQSDSLDCVKLLIQKDAHVNTPIYTGSVPIHLAAERGNVPLLLCLLNHGAHIDVYEDYDLSPIFLAAQKGQAKCLRILIDAAREREKIFLINKRATDGATPLLIASQEGHDKCVRILLENEADANISTNDESRCYPLQSAIACNQKKCVKLLLPVTEIREIFAHCDSTLHPVALALQLEDSEIICFLLSHGIPIDIKIPYGRTEPYTKFNYLEYQNKLQVLSYVAFAPSCVTKAQTLLQMGLKPCSESPEYISPVLCALFAKCLELAKLYFRYNASPNEYHPSALGNTVVLFALKNDLLKIAQTYKFQGEYLSTILGAGAEVGSCFHAVLGNSYRLGLFTLMHTVQASVSVQLNKQFAILIAILLSFGHHNHLDDKFLELIQDAETWKKLKKIETVTSSLAHLCRLKILQTMSAHQACSEEQMRSLPVPLELQDFLLFQEFEEGSKFIMKIYQSSCL